MKTLKTETILLKKTRVGMIVGTRVVNRYTVQAPKSREFNYKAAHKQLRNGDELIIEGTGAAIKPHLIRIPGGWIS